MSIGNCPIWKPNIGWEKCLRMAGEGDNIYDIGVTVAFLTPVRKDASKIPRDNDFSHRCVLFLQTRPLFWSLWLWSFCLPLPRLRICPMVSKPWQLKKLLWHSGLPFYWSSTPCSHKTTSLNHWTLPFILDNPCQRQRSDPSVWKPCWHLTVFKFDLQDADRSWKLR